MKDEKIMEMVKNGDINKVSILFERYHVLLYNFFYKKNFNQSWSEDLTQNVFERIIKYSHSFNATYPFRAWMFRIAKNVLANHYAKKMKVVNEESISNHAAFATGNVLDDIAEKEQNKKLHQAIALLNKEEREVIHFTRFQQLKYHEIASILQISESGVKMRVHRAMKKLKEHYLKLDKL